jgi:hypothetical protein
MMFNPVVTRAVDLDATARATAWDSWEARSGRRYRYELLREWAAGRAGIPDVGEGASSELKDIARLARISMCRVAVRTFVRGLNVVGFRSPTAADNDPAWDWWQHHRMDARQAVTIRQTVTYGESYVSVLPDEASGSMAYPATWSPLNCIADYDRPHDVFPTQALLITPGPGKDHTGLLVDRWTVTPVRMTARKNRDAATHVEGVTRRDITITGPSWQHYATYNGEPVCPVVRFIDETDDQAGRGIGVVEPLIALNQAMNQVNYDRLTVARFGAHDQKLIIGWSDTKERLARLSSAHIGVIDEEPSKIRIERWQASPLDPYNELLNEQREQFALEAAIPLWATGRVSNVSADTVAMIEAAHQRELQLKRDGFGESWEIVLRLAVTMNGGQQPDQAAETIWRSTQVHSFAAVVDGIQKLASVDVPVEELLDLIPGMTQQRAKAIRDAMNRNRTLKLLDALASDNTVDERAADDSETG